MRGYPTPRRHGRQARLSRLWKLLVEDVAPASVPEREDRGGPRRRRHRNAATVRGLPHAIDEHGRGLREAGEAEIADGVALDFARAAADEPHDVALGRRTAAAQLDVVVREETVEERA